MEIKEKNLFARYYDWMYDDLPDDVCTFFWGSVFIILFSPILIPGRLMGSYYDGFGDYFGKGFMAWLLFFLLALFGVPFWKLFGEEFINSLPVIIQLLILAFAGALQALVAVGIGAGIYYSYQFYKKHRKISPIEEEKPTFWEKTGDFIGAIRGKYCTKITWK